MARPIEAGPLEFAGNLAMRRVDFPEVGDFLREHDHYFDHVTFVVQGAVLFHRTDVPAPDRPVHGPAWVATPAQAQHRMIALQPQTVAYCVFAVRDEFGVVLQADEIEPADQTPRARYAH